MRTAFLALALILPYAADNPPFYDKVRSNEFSPRSDILVRHSFERGGTDQIWLVSTADPAKRHLVLRTLPVNLQ